MLGSNLGQLRLRHWLSDALTTRLYLIHIVHKKKKSKKSLFRSPKFIWTPCACAQLYSLAETPQPSSFGLIQYTRALLVCQDRRHLIVNPGSAMMYNLHTLFCEVAKEFIKSGSKLYANAGILYTLFLPSNLGADRNCQVVNSEYKHKQCMCSAS
jgi:hypothetical protein